MELTKFIVFNSQVDKLRRDNVSVIDRCKFLYDFLKKEIPNTHAFYIGLYNEYIDQLGFPFTCDEDKWDTADFRPLGNGPTSWVIKNRKPFILSNGNSKQHQSGSHFGNVSKTSKSALHFPMFSVDSFNNSVLVGVISIQSYEDNNYSQDAISFFEAIANKAGELFLPFIEAETVKSLQEKLALQANVTNKALYEITEEISKIKQLIDRNAPSDDILNQLEIFSSHCKELQSTMIVGKYEISSLNEKLKLDLLNKLSFTERKIVEKLLEGKENKIIAEEVEISHDSVKTHIKNACSKLNIENGRRGLYNLFNSKK